MVRSVARVAAIALAAFASMATSAEVEEVVSTVPLARESAVSVDVVPTLVLTVEPSLDGDPTPMVALQREADGTDVAGEVVVVNGAGGVELSFAPDAPLAPDEQYVFVVDGALEGYFYIDPVAGESVRLGLNGVANRVELPFATESAPTARFARRSTDPRIVRVSFSQDMAPLTVSTNTVSAVIDGVERDTQLVIYRGGELHEAEVTLFDPNGQEISLSFGAGIEAADGTPMAESSVLVE